MKLEKCSIYTHSSRNQNSAEIDGFESHSNSGKGCGYQAVKATVSVFWLMMVLRTS